MAKTNCVANQSCLLQWQKRPNDSHSTLDADHCVSLSPSDEELAVGSQKVLQQELEYPVLDIELVVSYLWL